jgi:hypothetical protein
MLDTMERCEMVPVKFNSVFRKGAERFAKTAKRTMTTRDTTSDITTAEVEE